MTDPSEHPSFEAGGLFAVTIARAMEATSDSAWMTHLQANPFMFFMGMYGTLTGTIAQTVGREGTLKILEMVTDFIQNGYKNPTERSSSRCH